jgi:hypothetical protein
MEGLKEILHMKELLSMKDGDEDGVYLYDVNTGRNQTPFSMGPDSNTNVGLDLEIPLGESIFLKNGS